MKRTLISLALSLSLILSLALGASATTLPLIDDQADLLTSEQEDALDAKAAALRDTYGMDFVIVTNQSLGGKTPEVYADDYFDNNGYGPDGALFLLSMEFRDWYISTCGNGIYALTDYGIQQLGELAVGYLADGAYYEAFDAYLDALIPYLNNFQTGAPMDGYADQSMDFYTGTQDKIIHYQENSRPSLLSRFLRSLPFSMIWGLVAAAVVIAILRASMNTKRRQSAASAYMEDGSFHLLQHRDLFLYSNVNKVRRQQSSSSGSHHSGGGSSVHRSSSGRSHGGGGGKF